MKTKRPYMSEYKHTVTQYKLKKNVRGTKSLFKHILVGDVDDCRVKGAIIKQRWYLVDRQCNTSISQEKS